MKPILHPTKISWHSLPSMTMLFWLLFVPAGLFGQSDRPCGAALIAADQCTYSNPVVFSNTSFQADAPINCPGNFTRDGWFRFLAPATSVTISRSVYCKGNPSCTLPGSPVDIALALYQGNCSALTVVEDCPAECFLGIACVEADATFGEATGLGDHFSGLNIGQEYFLRVLWDSSSTAPPDTVIVNIVSNAPCNLCLPCALGFTPIVLDQSAIQLHASESENAIQLEWESNLPTQGLQKTEVYRSPANLEEAWELIGSLPFSSLESSKKYRDVNPPSDTPLLYRVSILDAQGQRKFSNTIQARNSDESINFNWNSQPEGYHLQLITPSAGQFTMFNLRGQEVASHAIHAGYQEFSWPKRVLPSGIYLLQAQTSTQTQVLKVRVQ